MSDVDKNAPVTTPGKVKAPAVGLEVTVSVVVETNAFKADTPDLLAQAEAAFRDRVCEAYGTVELVGMRLIKINHHIGTDATYVYAATLKG